MATIEEEIQSSFKNEQQKAMINIMFTANWFKALHSSAMKPFGLSTEQYNILRILAGSKEERMKMSDVRNRMIDPSPNTTRLMDRLLEKGAVARERCNTDRRVVFVQITQQGITLLGVLDEALSNFFGALNGGITTTEAKTLNEIIENFRAQVENRVELAP